jgi:uncharacterized membrane protein
MIGPMSIGPPVRPLPPAPTDALPVRAVGAAAPLRWLARGGADLLRCPLPGVAHGLAIALFGAALAWFGRTQFWLLAGAFSGFLLVAPVVATGLYAVSRALERGQPAGLGTALAAWRPRGGALVTFGLLLALAGTGWVLTSAALITGFASAPVRGPADFVRVVVLDPQSWLFEAWLVLGGIMAAPVFASTVVAIPLLLDRRIGVLAAVLVSWRTVIENPLPLALWAALIMALTFAAMLPALLGMVAVVPWLAHASWHAYRELVDPSALPERP